LYMNRAMAAWASTVPTTQFKIIAIVMALRPFQPFKM
jgi:hypothetical protein